MTFEEISALWAKDARIDRTQLQNESANIGLLFDKYYKLLMTEKIEAIKLRHKYDSIKSKKHDFLMNPDPETEKLYGWDPPSHQLARTETPIYTAGDEDCQKISLALAIQEQKVEYLLEILSLIKGRGFAIRDIIEDRKFYGTET